MATNESVSSASRHNGSGISDDASTRLRFHFRMLSSTLMGVDPLTRSVGRGRRRCFAIELGFGVENVVFYADQDSVCVRLGKRLDIAQLARDSRALSACIVERLADRVQPFFGLRQQLAELAEFGLHRAEHAPDLGRAVLDGKRTKSELKAVQHC